jgi:hypothetical protein
MALLSIPAVLVEIRRRTRADDDATAFVAKTSGTPALAMRRELPRDVPDFSGRTTELAHLAPTRSQRWEHRRPAA